MKTSTGSLAILLSLLGSINLSAFANPLASSNHPSQSSLEMEFVNLKQRLAQMESKNDFIAVKNVTNKSINLSSSTALLVSFPSQMVIDVGQKDSYPLTLPLFQEIRSDSGELIAPVNTPVSLQIKPHKGGAIIVADSIIINGQIISIDARSTKILGRTVTKTTAQQMARQNSAVIGNLFTSFSGVTTSSVETQQKLGFLGAGIGILSGLSTPDNVRIVEIPAGAVHILKVQE